MTEEVLGFHVYGSRGGLNRGPLRCQKISDVLVGRSGVVERDGWVEINKIRQDDYFAIEEPSNSKPVQLFRNRKDFAEKVPYGIVIIDGHYGIRRMQVSDTK